MMADIPVRICIEELCQHIRISREEALEIVSHGIIYPQEDSSGTWRFDTRAIAVASRAARLRRELDLEWQGVALALELLERINRLERENQRLKARLARFVE